MEREPSNGPAGRLSDLAKLVLILSGLGLGFVFGLSAPVAYFGLAPGPVAGFTSVGLVFLLGVLVGIVSLIVAAVAAVFDWRTSWALAALAISLSIAGGILLGNWAAPRVGVPWAVRTTATPPPRTTFGPFPSVPLTQEVSGAVRLTLEDVPYAVPASPQPYDGGLFGHWCTVEPDGQTVAGLSAMDVATMRDHTLWLELTLIAPTGPYAVPIDVPWITIQVRTEEGVVDAYYVGTGRPVKGGPSGRVDFNAIPNEWSGEDWPATLSGRITWSCP